MPEHKPEPQGALEEYRRKRDFEKTSEPSGEAKVRPSKVGRFVIQKHAASRLHYDLRIEMDGVFKSWAVARGPSLDPRDKRLAVEVEDHPLDYGDFEGTIPKGEYGGGTVMVWDRGHWRPDGPKTPEEGLADGDFKFILDGERLHGGWVLVRMKGDRWGGKRTNWLLIKHRDAFAVDAAGDAILEDATSIASGRTMEAIAAGQGPGPKPFMLDGGGRADPAAVWGQDGGDAGQSGASEPPKAKPAPEAKAAAKAKSAPRTKAPPKAKATAKVGVAAGKSPGKAPAKRASKARTAGQG